MRNRVIKFAPPSPPFRNHVAQHVVANVNIFKWWILASHNN